MTVKSYSHPTCRLIPNSRECCCERRSLPCTHCWQRCVSAVSPWNTSTTIRSLNDKRPAFPLAVFSPGDRRSLVYPIDAHRYTRSRRLDDRRSLRTDADANVDLIRPVDHRHLGQRNVDGLRRESIPRPRCGVGDDPHQTHKDVQHQNAAAHVVGNLEMPGCVPRLLERQRVVILPLENETGGGGEFPGWRRCRHLDGLG